MARNRGGRKGIGRSINNLYSRLWSKQEENEKRERENYVAERTKQQSAMEQARAEENSRKALASSLNNENYPTASEIGAQPLSSQTKEQVNQMSPERRDAALAIGNQVKQSIVDRYAEMAEQHEKQAQGREHDLEHDRD